MSPVKLLSGASHTHTRHALTPVRAFCRRRRRALLPRKLLPLVPHSPSRTSTPDERAARHAQGTRRGWWWPAPRRTCRAGCVRRAPAAAAGTHRRATERETRRSPPPPPSARVDAAPGVCARTLCV
jgi:hypothetical protein